MVSYHFQMSLFCQGQPPLSDLSSWFIIVLILPLFCLWGNFFLSENIYTPPFSGKIKQNDDKPEIITKAKSSL